MVARTKAQVLRLAGKVGKRHRTFPLAAGDNRVGSSRANQIILIDRTVSRHHALVRLGTSGVAVSDLGSTNGTFIGARRIRSSPIQPGQTLRFGTVALRLEALDPEDAKLALEIRPASKYGLSKGWTQAGETTRVSILTSRERTWLGLAEGVTRILAEGGTSPLSQALEMLRCSLGARAAALLQFGTKKNPAILASVGHLDKIRNVERLEGSLRLLLPDPGDVACAVPEPEDPTGLTLALLNLPPSPMGLFIEGAFDGRVESQPLLALVLRLLVAETMGERVKIPPRVSPRAQSGGGKLYFPENYVPGISAAMEEIYSRLKTVLQGNIPTLICGETGVGKEPLATILHHNSPQQAGPLVAINCAAIPADLLEAELFGIAHGAATGVRARRGKFLDAHGGSILLDEIGELTPPLQAKLLRVLQEREVTPVGGQPRAVSARIIASTNQNLQEAMRQGTFRRDLYYRLAGCVLELPPLRQRPEDIPGLLQHFLDRHTLELAKALRGVTLKALRALTDYPWPGNVRELDYEARRLALLCEDGQMIDSPLLSPQITQPTPKATSHRPADR